jgi:DNA-binding MarR family transcriptional regulator
VIIALFAGSAVLLAAWYVSARRAAEPVLPLRLFRNSVFAVSAAISLAAGFAMFGALSYLPLFLQVVHGVSPTISGVYLLPMVLGLLITSIGSGQIIARTGRYKVFPIVGSAVMAVALYLLSTLDETTPTWQMNVYFFLLGFALGLIIQVLVIAVQNTASYSDLGAATSGVTFFRTIGGSFGVSVFGAIFSNQLASHLAAALAGKKLPPGFTPASVQSKSSVLQALPADLRQAILHAYSLALHPVFLTAVPIAGVAFILSWMLREVPLRTSAGAPTPAAETLRGSASAADLGEAIGGAPTHRTSAQEVERVLSRLSATDLRRFGYAKLARAAGLDLPGGACWILTMLAKQGATPGPELAKEAGVTMAEGHPNAQLLVDRGLITRTDGVLALTPAGAETAERLFAAKRDWLQRQLAGWSPEQHAELDQVLTKLSRAMLGEDSDRHLVGR